MKNLFTKLKKAESGRFLAVCGLFLTGLTFTSCEDDTTTENTCVTCTNTQNGATLTQKVCNYDGQAYINGEGPLGNYQSWIDTLTQQGYTCK